MADAAALAPTAADMARTKARPKTKGPKVKVDFWATDLNTAEIGIMKRMRPHLISSPRIWSCMARP